MEPVAQSDLDSHRHEYRGYVLLPAFRSADDAMRERAASFWQEESALPNPHTGEQRLLQLVYLIENADGDIAGVSTAYPARIPMLGNDWYLIYRMYIRVQDRLPGLMRAVTRASFELTRERRRPDGALGLVIMAENTKLTRPGMRRMFMRAGCRYAGLNRIQQETWVKRFDGSPQ